MFVLGFTTYRHDRANSKEGGAAIPVRFSISHNQSAIIVIGVNAVGIEIKHAKDSLRVITSHNRLQSVLSEHLINSVSLPNSHISIFVASDLGARHITRNYWQKNSSGRRLASLSIRNGLSIETLDGHTWFPGNRNRIQTSSTIN